MIFINSKLRCATNPSRCISLAYEWLFLCLELSTNNPQQSSYIPTRLVFNPAMSYWPDDIYKFEIAMCNKNLLVIFLSFTSGCFLLPRTKFQQSAAALLDSLFKFRAGNVPFGTMVFITLVLRCATKSFAFRL